MYRLLIRPFFFLFSAERAHYLTLGVLRFLVSLPGGRWMVKSLFYPRHQKVTEVLGLVFPNRIGLAAGFDKNAHFLDMMALLGFGHVEIGTVTPKGQPGNEKPRLFRLPKDKALINRMGFNNDGVDTVVRNLQRPAVQRARKELGLIVGGNIGKNKVTPNEDAWKDYVTCFEALQDLVDYLVVNVSSPNTPGLRELQDKGPLTHILEQLQARNKSRTKPLPILLKIAPDMHTDKLTDIVEIVKATRLDGLIISNTTISREDLKTEPGRVEEMGAGGVSGRPVFEASTRMLQQASQLLDGEKVLIGVGGVFNSHDFQAKRQAGASLVQVYTGFIYEGPAMVRKLLEA